MNQEIKGRWIEALESGRLSQTIGKLADDNGFCCLGVLCEIAVEDGVISKINDTRNDERIRYVSNVNAMDWSSALLPNTVENWAELDDNCPVVNISAVEDLGITVDPEVAGPHNSISLAQLNDSGVPFEDIAKVIRELL